MKSTGIVRQMDPLGRVVIPLKFVKLMASSPKTHLKYSLTCDKIILRNTKFPAFLRKC